MPDIIATVHAYAAAVNALDPEAFASLFTADAELHDPVGAPPRLGPSGARAFMEQFLPLLHSVHLRAGEIHVNGHNAAFTWALEATGKNGSTAAAHGIDVFECNAEGRIARTRGYWDPAPFVSALMR